MGWAKDRSFKKTIIALVSKPLIAHVQRTHTREIHKEVRAIRVEDSSLPPIDRNSQADEAGTPTNLEHNMVAEAYTSQASFTRTLQ